MLMRIGFLLYCIGLLCCTFVSCADKEEVVPIVENGLTVRFHTGSSISRATETYSEESEMMRDNVIDHVDVFIFNAETGDLVEDCYWHIDKERLDTQPILLIPGNWKTRFANHSVCEVYVVANLHSNESLNNIQTFAQLESTLTDQHDNIYQSVANWDKEKLFTMSGNKQDWHPADEANVCLLDVELVRLAAKVEITVNLDFPNKQYINDKGDAYDYPANGDDASLLYSVHNYATTVQVLPGYDEIFNCSFGSSTEKNIQYITNDKKAKIIFYTYPNEWTKDILKETYVIFNAKLNKPTGTPAADSEYYLNNYYKIPLLLSTAEKKMLERNHWYKVTANISAMGNPTSDNPVELTDVHYKVAEWKDMEIEVGDDNPMYLELSEYEVVMRNVDTYDLTFASSSNLKETEEKAEIEIKEIYYYNKDGKKITITDSEILDNTYLKVEGDLNGKLTIHSPIPANKTIRYIELTVKNEQYKENDSGTSSCIKTVTIMQYPLEYITGISGLYSYLDLENDDRYKGIWPTYKEEFVTKLNFTSEDGQYVISTDIQSVIVNGLNNHIGTSVDMKSKFYVENASGEGRIFRIDYSYLDEYIEVPWGGTTDNPKVYVRGFIEVENSGNREYIPDKESDGRDKRYNLKISEKENGNYVKIGTDYIEVENGTGHYSIESSKDNGDGEYYFAYIHYTGSDINDITYYLCTTIDNKDYKPELPFYLSDNGTASNNQMYHVVITATSSDYTLARPIMNDDIVDPYNQDNDNLVSPSFMLASQLGNSSTISWSEAKEQCKNYVEVGEDGTVYDDWRLPTAAEINIIIKYQTDPNVNTKDDNAVMDYVLNYGDQDTPDYWVSRYNYSMQIPESGEGTLHEGKENEGSNRRVRCVRDYRISDE